MKNAFFETKTEPVTVMVQKSLTSLPHLHKEIEMVYVLKGRSLVYADRFCTEIGDGDLFIAFPNQIHYYNASQHGEFIVIILSPDTVFGMKSLFNENLPKRNVFKPTAEIGRLLTESASSFDTAYGKTVAVGLLNQVFGILAKSFDLKPRIKSDNKTLQSVLNYCNEKFKSDITLDEISEELHLSKYHISHLFNSKLGIGFNTYINTLRINTACEMLEGTDKKTADISEETGFGSIRSFNRAFLQITGMSPLQYRKSFNNELKQAEHS